MCEHDGLCSSSYVGWAVHEKGSAGALRHRQVKHVEGKLRTPYYCYWQNRPTLSTENHFLKRGPTTLGLESRVIVSLWSADDRVQGKKQGECTPTGRRTAVSDSELWVQKSRRAHAIGTNAGWLGSFRCVLNREALTGWGLWYQRGIHHQAWGP